MFHVIKCHSFRSSIILTNLLFEEKKKKMEDSEEIPVIRTYACSVFLKRHPETENAGSKLLKIDAHDVSVLQGT